MSATLPLTGPLDWHLRQRSADVLAAPGVLSRLGESVQELEGQRVFLVSDLGLEAAGHVASACDSLVRADIEFELFAGVEENPTEACVERGLAAARGFAPDVLVALGGGSVMDAAKGVNFLLTNGGTMEDYWGFGKATKPMLPSVGIPCTAGTGSEAQSFALISRTSDHVKMACGDVKARFTRVLLDPDILETVPRDVAAVTGMDALSHALESYVTKSRNPVSQAYASASWRALSAAFPQALGGNGTVEVRSEMLAGAYLAGAAIESSMLGLAHALANPLTAHFGITHGVAVGLTLPPVLRFNAMVCEANYRELASVVDSDGSPSLDAAPGEVLARRVEQLRAQAGLAQSLRDVGVPGDALAEMAKEAAGQWTAAHNPRKATVEQILDLYRECLEHEEVFA